MPGCTHFCAYLCMCMDTAGGCVDVHMQGQEVADRWGAPASGPTLALAVPMVEPLPPGWRASM